MYQPREIDLQVTQAMLAGNVNLKEIAEAIGRAASTVSNCLKQPVACAWIANKVHALIHTRIGLIDAAMLQKALAGDVRAADLMYRRFGKMIDKSIHISGSLGDLSKFSDADLEAQLAAELKRHPELAPALSPPASSAAPAPATEGQTINFSGIST